MSDPHQEGKDFGDFLKSLAPEQIEEVNKKQIEQAEAEHKEFKEAFAAGKCYVCGNDLTHFDADRPCLHWVFRPAGFTKWHFPSLAQVYGYHQIEGYLRWVANEEAKAQNINDLREEGNGKLIELTITYKEYEWAFSCGENDYAGHKTDAEASQRPHYHFQMRVNKAAFIRYNDFHVPFSEMDIIEIEAMNSAPDKIRRVNVGGEGMRDLLNEDTLEHVVRHGRRASDPETAPVGLTTFIVADEGTEISGEALEALIAEAKETGATMSSLVDRLPNVRAQTIVGPGPGVAEQAPRSGRRRGNRKQPQD